MIINKNYPLSSIESDNDSQNDISVLFISNTDLDGREFNGYFLCKKLKKENIKCYLSVAYSNSSTSFVYEYGNGAHKNIIQRVVRYINKRIL